MSFRGDVAEFSKVGESQAIFPVSSVEANSWR